MERRKELNLGWKRRGEVVDDRDEELSGGGVLLESRKPAILK